MCGCMLMHAGMDHTGHQPANEPESMTQAKVMPGTSRQKCIHCSFPLQEGFAFCPNCGMNLKTVECPACGQRVDPTWRACAFCGSPLGKGQPVAA